MREKKEYCYISEPCSVVSISSSLNSENPKSPISSPEGPINDNSLYPTSIQYSCNVFEKNV